MVEILHSVGYGLQKIVFGLNLFEQKIKPNRSEPKFAHPYKDSNLLQENGTSEKKNQIKIKKFIKLVQ